MRRRLPFQTRLFADNSAMLLHGGPRENVDAYGFTVGTKESDDVSAYGKTGTVGRSGGEGGMREGDRHRHRHREGSET
jgi:hypothetical protein